MEAQGWQLADGTSIYGVMLDVTGPESFEFVEFETAERRELHLKDLAPRDREALVAHRDGIIRGRVIGVFDGDTLTILTETHQNPDIRIHGIDAPERGQPFSNRAREKLSELCFGQEVEIRVTGKSFSRETGFVFVDGLNVNLEMVRSGFAWHSDRFTKSDDDLSSAFEAAQQSAISEENGLWTDYRPMAPWDYRSRNRRKLPEEAIADGEKVRVLNTRFRSFSEHMEHVQPQTKRTHESLFRPITFSLFTPVEAARGTFWLNTSSNKRHTLDCRDFARTREGRFCSESEGDPCGRCH